MNICFLSDSVWEGVYLAQIQRSESRKLLANAQRPFYLLAETIRRYVYIILYHWANNRSKYVDACYISMINDKDGHIPSPLIMSTCKVLLHAHLEWDKNKGVHPEASKSWLKADRPDDSNYFNFKNVGGKNESSCAAMGHKLVILPGIAERYTFLMNSWNTLPDSYQQRVYKETLGTAEHQIRQAENPMPAVVIRVEAAGVHNGSLPMYSTSQVALEEPEIGRTDPNILIDNN